MGHFFDFCPRYRDPGLLWEPQKIKKQNKTKQRPYDRVAPRGPWLSIRYSKCFVFALYFCFCSFVSVVAVLSKCTCTVKKCCEGYVFIRISFLNSVKIEGFRDDRISTRISCFSVLSSIWATFFTFAQDIETRVSYGSLELLLNPSPIFCL
jgi:hypothetical protein